MIALVVFNILVRWQECRRASLAVDVAAAVSAMQTPRARAFIRAQWERRV